MKYTIAILCALALSTGSAFAQSTHTGSTVGPRGGVWNSTSGTTCANHSCSHQRTTTAPNGLQATKTGSSSCANSSCTRNVNRTGFYGRSSSHTGTTTHQ
jgi:hypothetical protein